jgi:hypothetical protein
VRPGLLREAGSSQNTQVSYGSIMRRHGHNASLSTTEDQDFGDLRLEFARALKQKLGFPRCTQIATSLECSDGFIMEFRLRIAERLVDSAVQTSGTKNIHTSLSQCPGQRIPPQSQTGRMTSTDAHEPDLFRCLRSLSDFSLMLSVSTRHPSLFYDEIARCPLFIVALRLSDLACSGVGGS